MKKWFITAFLLLAAVGALGQSIPQGSGGGKAPNDAQYVTRRVEADLSAEHSIGALTTGLLLNTVATAQGTLSAYAGTSCTNQFPRSLNASGAATCASIADADLPTSLSGSTVITQTASTFFTAEQALNALTTDRLLRVLAGGVLGITPLSSDGTNVTLTSGGLLLTTNDQGALGSAALSWSDLFLASDAIIDFSNNNARITHTNNDLRISVAGNDNWRFIPSATIIRQDTSLIFSGDGIDNTNPALLGREDAAIFQQGVDSATPVAQTYKAPDGSGTDVAGASMTHAPGRGTGTGAGGPYIIATAPAGSTGSTQNALINRIQVESTGGLRWLTGTKPTCAAGIRGTAYYVAGATTVLDTFEVCRKDAADAYAWVTLF